jgi:hypothetical protein
MLSYIISCAGEAMKRPLLAIAIIADLAATGLIIYGVIRNGLAAFGSVMFDAALAVLWLVAGLSLLLALRQ